jgi:hypothetical protein
LASTLIERRYKAFLWRMRCFVAAVCDRRGE